ncbi:guanitoxin biosynthesis heme-dependent pre-guanitoxin N-hydroxylase GntA [Lysobacter sp. H23M47]|uniref:guanitoxin biosynthesis heme-dependent pre-guanitoxin N-hydroxylase GntA n=1 Tax=Lysobacter sp. H23M47 TaxID=2781024 RepID=UPI0018802A09|nr:guanitoxin biosynthesis heme-dependent pre-guanitoxin N-hydroxylase GntA [Lysobacter sp. H23M47]QOW24430.1 YqcI/YcgG family protein [Lysobacter sp. H23M47]
MDFSRYSAPDYSWASAPTPGQDYPPGTTSTTLASRFLAFVDDPRFPCVGSKVALARDAIEVVEFADLRDPAGDGRLLDGLSAFGARLDAEDPDAKIVRSYVAVYAEPRRTDERQFEQLLWKQLQRLHDLDVARGNAWASDVANDPDDRRFSLSLSGHPFFVIGLHPGASRMARRTPMPALVFNSHRQFERLRADGRFRKMQAATRKRDEQLQGSINPNLADFGEAGETRQYSGRAVGRDWKCPFQFRGGN